MTMSIYTNQLTSTNTGNEEITSSDIIMLNGNNIVHSIDAEYNGINPIPSFDVVKSMSVDLSGKLSVIDKELSAHDAKLSSHMQYYGAFNRYETDDHLSTWLLSTFLITNLNATSTDVIDKGKMFKFLSSVSLSDSANVSIELFNNDYIITNTDIIVGQAMISSFDVIRDAQVEVNKFHDEIYNALCETSSTLTDDISSTSAFLSDQISSVSKDLTAISNQLSTAISSKIFIDDRISGLSGCNDLSIIKLSADDYAALLRTGQVVSNCIYIIENSFKNMYGQQIKNLAPGTDLSDAVNLGQLLSVSNAIPISVSQLSNDAGYLTQHQSLSNYYKKTETSGSTQLETAFASKLDPSDVKISYVKTARQIVLSSGNITTTVDCNDFIKDGMLSSAELCGTTLVLKFTTDAESAPISVELSNFVDDYDDRISALSDSISSISTDLSNYLDKRTGGYVSGDIGILSGNFIQTTTLSNVHNYSAANSFIQAESTKYGDPATGSKTYCILSIVVPEKAIIISGDLGYSNISSVQYPTQSSSKTFRNGLGNGSISLTLKHSLINTSNANPCLSDLMWSLALFDIGNTNFGHLTAIQETTIEGIQGTKLQFDKLPADIGPAIAGKSLTDYISDFTDVNGDNALYVRGFVELGNQIPPQFISQYAAGGAVRAIGKYTHAEGRDTIADGRYSHAEGTATIAGGVASHSEGQSTHAIGRSSHSEGEGTRATMPMSHAEGYGSKATEAGAHAEGGYWLSSNYSGNYVGGTASGKASHAEGHNSIASNEAAHAEGYSTIASGGYGSHSEGHSTSAVGNYSHTEGKGTFAYGSGSHAEGLTSIANVYGSHVEGAYGIGNGNYVHVEGDGDYANRVFMLCSDLSTLYINASQNVLSTLSSYGDIKGYAKLNSLTTIYQLAGYSLNGNNLCIYLLSSAPSNLSESSINVQLFKKYAAGTASHAEGHNTRALTSYTHAEGNQSYATNYGAHAEGYQTSAVGQYSHSEGFITLAKETAAHAEGYHTEANKKQSHAAGHYAKANHDYAWCWNGVVNKEYESNAEGTFNINPKDGIAGFYIGENSLCSILSDYSTNDAVTDLKNNIASSISGITQISIDNNSDLSNIISACITMRDLISSLYTAINQ